MDKKDKFHLHFLECYLRLNIGNDQSAELMQFIDVLEKHLGKKGVRNLMPMQPGDVKETTLTHHTFFTTKLIPKLDKLIDDKNMGKMREMV
jgi:hypothetical protein